MNFRPELVGLREREAKVYLAALELGAATAQQIAIKTGIQRGSAYAAIGILKKRGMMYESTKGKKQHFNAEKPAQLLRLIQEEKKKLQKREEDLKANLPMLEALSAVRGKLEMTRFEGEDGLEMIRKTLLGSKVKSCEIIRFSHGADGIWNQKFKKAGFRVKRMDFESEDSEKTATEIAIFGDFIVLADYRGEPQGCLIKSHDLARLLRTALKLNGKA